MATYYDEDGNPVEVDETGPADLRKQLKAKTTQLDDLQKQLDELVNEKRAAERETVLKDLNPKVRDLVEEFNLDPKAVAEKYGDLFKAPEPKAPEAPVVPADGQNPDLATLAAQYAALQTVQNGAEPSPQQTTQQEADLLKAAGDLTDPKAIANFMASINAAM